MGESARSPCWAVTASCRAHLAGAVSYVHPEFLDHRGPSGINRSLGPIQPPVSQLGQGVGVGWRVAVGGLGTVTWRREGRRLGGGEEQPVVMDSLR